MGIESFQDQEVLEEGAAVPTFLNLVLSTLETGHAWTSSAIEKGSAWTAPVLNFIPALVQKARDLGNTIAEAGNIKPDATTDEASNLLVERWKKEEQIEEERKQALKEAAERAAAIKKIEEEEKETAALLKAQIDRADAIAKELIEEEKREKQEKQVNKKTKKKIISEKKRTQQPNNGNSDRVQQEIPQILEQTATELKAGEETFAIARDPYFNSMRHFGQTVWGTWQEAREAEAYVEVQKNVEAEKVKRRKEIIKQMQPALMQKVKARIDALAANQDNPDDLPQVKEARLDKAPDLTVAEFQILAEIRKDMESSPFYSLICFFFAKKN